MRILHTVESYPPDVGGMQEVVRQLSERLAAMGHDVTVATSKVDGREGDLLNKVRIREFEVFGNIVEGMRGDVSGYREFLRGGDFDVMTNFAAQQWATDAAITILDTIPSRKVLVPTGFSRLYSPRYQKYFRSMKEWMRRYDANVFLSETYQDATFARQHGIGNRVLIPNGAGEDEFLRESGTDVRGCLDIPPDAFLVLHVGSHTGDKGHREALEIFRRARVRHAVFLVVGNETGGCNAECRATATTQNATRGYITAGKRVIVRSLSRAETVAAFRSADLFLFPSNIECSPLVLFEAAASGTPFLATDVGNAAEIAEWTSAGVILPTDKSQEGGLPFLIHRLASALLPFLSTPIPAGYSKARTEESARVLEMLYASPEERRRMAEAGSKAWKSRFTWEKIVLQYEALYGSLTSAALAEEAGGRSYNLPGEMR